MLTRLSIATAAFIGFAASTLAGEPPACVGKSMLPELAVSAPKLSYRLASAEQTIPNGRAILWRITDKSGKIAPSYLFGTFPLTSAKIHALPVETRSAIENANVVALQLKEVIDPNEFRLAFASHPHFMMMPGGKDMWDLIPDADEGFIRSAPQITPDTIAGMNTVQPWVITMTLAFPTCELKRLMAGRPTLDRSIGEIALARQIPVVGLEKIDEMMAIFASEPLDSQARYLVATAKFGDRLADWMEELYLARRISSLRVLSIQGLPTDQPDSTRMAYFEDKVVDQRIQLTLQRSLPLVARGGAFIAVSAIRLPGDKGLVELFRKAGYEVTPVN